MAAREAAEEQRMQEIDAERRLQTLRGIPSVVEPTLPGQTDYVRHADGKGSDDGQGKLRKRRRIAGEDDTERDLRLAKEDWDKAHSHGAKSSKRKKTSDAPLTDQAGHINLFPVEHSHGRGPKNNEAEAENARKKKEYEDQYTMRFSNAAGFKQAVDQKPWYFDGTTVNEENRETGGKDVWGNEDSTRKMRESIRVATEDPLAMMQKGVQNLRQVEKEQQIWKEERALDMRAMEKAERRHIRKSKRNSVDDLDSFSLDTTDINHDREEKSHYRSRHRSHERNKNKYGTGWEENVVGSNARSRGKYSSQFAGLI